jgi:plastocyanin
MIALILAASTALVSIQQFAFKPASVTVHAGDTVRFVNRDDEAHTVTARGGTFDSGGMDTNDAWTYRFSKPGKYAYFCSLHPYMTGTIVVLPQGQTQK